jgi:threonine dehydrogenase-like Zn-dependent dehydrogenase
MNSVAGAALPAMMEAARFEGPGDVRLVRLPVPAPSAGQVLVRVACAGICRTDLHIVGGHFPVAPPRVLGHEIAGEIAALGAGVAEFAPGDRVGVYPALFCGRCAECRRGRYRACANFQGLGNTRDGGWAEYVLAEAGQIVPLQRISTEDAAWLEPISCILRALRGIESGGIETTLVMGAGPLGLLTLLILRRQGVPVVLVADPNPARLEQARNLGATGAIEVPRTGPAPRAAQQVRAFAPLGVDLLFDTTGRSVAAARAAAWAAHGGTLLLFGVPAPGSRLAVPLATVFRKEITVRASAGNGAAEYRAAAQMLEEAPLRLADLVGRRIVRADIPAALAAMAQPGHGGKVLVVD